MVVAQLEVAGNGNRIDRQSGDALGAAEGARRGPGTSGNRHYRNPCSNRREVFVGLGQDGIGTFVRGLEGGPPGVSADEDVFGLVQPVWDVRFDCSVSTGRNRLEIAHFFSEVS